MPDTDKALELDPNSAWAWYWRGRLNMPSGDMASAISDFRRSSKVDPIYCRTNFRICEMTHVLWRIGKIGPSALGEIKEKNVMLTLMI
ncbi:tetratricopeptide repeat protein [Ruegeria lacuscaerulensis]|uniref:tetratricopeptide repeat protein n=1 Tax=Ruegeria lacuscaerulensis TaxID=55218 RepID=UPI003AF836F8